MYVVLCMSYHNITVSDEIYRKLSHLKGDLSFNALFAKFLEKEKNENKGVDLSEFLGAWKITDAEWNEIETKMVVLDTNILVEILRNSKHSALLVEKISKTAPVSTTMINEYELLLGAKFSDKPFENETKVQVLLKKLTVLHLTKDSVALASQIQANLMKKGQQVDFADLLIAAIALANNQTLVTRNVKHFERVPGLKIEKW